MSLVLQEQFEPVFVNKEMYHLMIVRIQVDLHNLHPALNSFPSHQQHDQGCPLASVYVSEQDFYVVFFMLCIDSFEYSTDKFRLIKEGDVAVENEFVDALEVFHIEHGIGLRTILNSL